MVVWMAEVKRSDSFLLSLSNENKNLIPELSTAMPTLPTLKPLLEHICHIFYLSPSLFYFSCSVLTSVFFFPPENQLEMESYRSHSYRYQCETFISVVKEMETMHIRGVSSLPKL